jgi:hypothetical protein
MGVAVGLLAAIAALAGGQGSGRSLSPSIINGKSVSERTDHRIAAVHPTFEGGFSFSTRTGRDTALNRQKKQGGGHQAAPFRWGCVRRYFGGQIFQITPVPGIWTKGPFAAPTKCESAPRSRTAP